MAIAAFLLHPSTPAAGKHPKESPTRSSTSDDAKNMGCSKRRINSVSSINFILNPQPEEKFEQPHDFFKTVMNQANTEPNPADWYGEFSGLSMHGNSGIGHYY